MFNKHPNDLTHVWKMNRKKLSEVTLNTEIIGSNLVHSFFQTLYFLPFFRWPVWALREKSLELLSINVSSFLPSSSDSSFQAATDPSWVFVLTLKSIINQFYGMKKSTGGGSSGRKRFWQKIGNIIY